MASKYHTSYNVTDTDGPALEAAKELGWARAYRGYTIGLNGTEYSYRAHTWDMWSAPTTLAECKAAIDAELASYSTSPADPDPRDDMHDRTVEG